ncbi:phosphatase PAP2 family protein [Streptomyces sp. HMX87]|uniref:phosphatase PAP2 family protein n=1 Tax=Streptomyces sp. HMX87 TaxID=3390849 RepID=UPI003A88A557
MALGEMDHGAQQGSLDQEGAGFIDTVAVHHTWGSMSQGHAASVSNPCAAMPSMHIGWSTWCGTMIAVFAGHRWAKVLGILYPVATLLVIISTANHFWTDALGGLICLGFGFAFSYVWFGAFPWQLPQYVIPVPKGLRRSGGCPQ